MAGASDRVLLEAWRRSVSAARISAATIRKLRAANDVGRAGASCNFIPCAQWPANPMISNADEKSVDEGRLKIVTPWQTGQLQLQAPRLESRTNDHRAKKHAMFVCQKQF